MIELYPEDIEFIKKQLKSYNACDFPVKNRKIIPQNVTIKTLEKVLKTGLTDGPSMRAIQCLFQTIFLSEKDVKMDKYGIYSLKKGMNEWFQNITKIGQGGYGIIYRTFVINENIQVIIKVPTQSSYNQEQSMREYLVGLVLNDLRYLVPNFAYTLGAFSCSVPSSITNTQICTRVNGLRDVVVYEKITGLNLHYGIELGKLSVIESIPVIAMVLLALEVAQRECRFTHYDLHTGNIMLAENMPDYEVVLDDAVYKITKPKYVPIIIDYGMSSVYINDTCTGLNGEPRYNQYMVPGHDMYYFIYRMLQIFRAGNSQDTNMDILVKILGTHRQGKHILDRLLVDGKKIDANMYNENRYKDEGNLQYLLNNAPGASETPIQLFKLLYKNYPDLLSGKVTRVNRDKLYSLSYTSSIKSYYDILDDSALGTKDLIKTIENCTDKRSSYILTKYQRYILEKYNKILRSKDLVRLINGIGKDLDRSAISRDIAVLNGVFDITPPKPGWNKIIDDLTSVSPFSMNLELKLLVVKNMVELMEYVYDVKPYFDMYYTILELGLEKDPSEYGKWVKKFIVSENYRFYTENLDTLMEGIRWTETLLSSVRVNPRIQGERSLIKYMEYAKFWGF